MFEAEILGFQYIDMVGDNGPINGYKVWYAYSPNNTHVNGRCCASAWLDSAKWNKLPLHTGDIVGACYNAKGKIDKFIPADVLALMKEYDC